MDTQGPAGPSAAARRDFYWLRSFVAGGVAGCCAKTTIAPLDRVKILLQAHNQHYKHLGVFSTLCAVPKKEGYLGLYKGNGAMMIRIFPYGAIQFMAFDQYKKLIKKKLGISGHVHNLMAGSMAGANVSTLPLSSLSLRFSQIRRRKKPTCDDMFAELMQSSCTDREQLSAWRHSVAEARKELSEREERRKDAMLRLMGEQTDMMKRLLELQESQQEHRHPPTPPHIHCIIACPPSQVPYPPHPDGQEHRGGGSGHPATPLQRMAQATECCHSNNLIVSVTTINNVALSFPPLPPLSGYLVRYLFLY
ncbi:graves disease carrier protein isoform X7 [Chelonia mydas]|uniref:graves disease carrier protein isoform X7 n=1 Tax=Chelonia mydas TaxID=8469 RepID=UPI001CA90B0A|nr:graves disease carrier protein isoform X7 [Chelonia mydas]